jgi:hypothetical protein
MGSDYGVIGGKNMMFVLKGQTTNPAVKRESVTPVPDGKAGCCPSGQSLEGG